MKRNTYTSIIRTLGCLLLLPVFASSCIHEDPELTADGEIGVDPTAVNIMTNLILETPFDPIDISRNTRAEEETEFLHRFTVSAYEGTQKVASQVIFQKVQTGETTISIPVRLKLHARKYQIAVWADYTGKTGDTYQLFYNAEDKGFIMRATPYKANSKYYDAFYGSTSLDLSAYPRSS